VRYEVKQYLAAHGEEIEEGFQQADLANNGLWVKVGDDHVRILKADEGGVPAPGDSKARQAYFRQELLPGIVGDAPATQSGRNFLIIWDVDENYTLTGLRLAYPKSGTASSVEVEWIIDIPHPAEAITQVPAVQPVEDLPISADVEEGSKAAAKRVE
jgi:hypothetical protein